MHQLSWKPARAVKPRLLLTQSNTPTFLETSITSCKTKIILNFLLHLTTHQHSWKPARAVKPSSRKQGLSTTFLTNGSINLIRYK